VSAVLIAAPARVTGPQSPIQTSNPHKVSKPMSNSSSVDVVKGFFSAFGKGDAESAVDSFHEQASIVAVRPGDRKGNLYGTYSGREGARAFITAVGKSFDTQAFSVDHVIGEGKLAFASGTFTHKLRSTGKLFTSDWALKCTIQDGRILEYHFYEDSEAFRDASR
jgi:uncharacterized protein